MTTSMWIAILHSSQRLSRSLWRRTRGDSIPTWHSSLITSCTHRPESLLKSKSKLLPRLFVPKKPSKSILVSRTLGVRWRKLSPGQRRLQRAVRALLNLSKMLKSRRWSELKRANAKTEQFTVFEFWIKIRLTLATYSPTNKKSY